MMIQNTQAWLVLVLTGLWTQISYAQSLTATKTSPPGEYSFYLNNPSYDIATFYDFKDGQFSTYAGNTQLHHYNKAGTFDADVHHVEIYRPGVLRSALPSPIVVPSGQNSTQPIVPVNMTGVNIEVSQTWDNAPDDENFYIITIENNIIASDDDGLVTFYLDPSFIVQNAYNYDGTDYISFSSNLVEWHYHDLPFGAQRNLFVHVFVDQSQISSIQQTVYTEAILDSDNTPDNYVNQSTWGLAFTPHDPNIITVSHTCLMMDYPHGQQFNYLVNFQNDGTGPAQDVTVEIELPDTSLMDTSTLLFIDASHPCTYGIVGNLLVVQYLNINLPGSKQPCNEVIYPTNQTKGFFYFSLCSKPNLQDGEMLYASANIYFDDQPPIMTNVAETVISDCDLPISPCDNAILAAPQSDQKQSIQDQDSRVTPWVFTAYPNPVSGTLFVELPSLPQGQTADLTLLHLDGRVALHRSVFGSGPHTIDISHLKRSTYIYSIRSEETSKFGKIIKQ